MFIRNKRKKFETQKFQQRKVQIDARTKLAEIK